MEERHFDHNNHDPIRPGEQNVAFQTFSEVPVAYRLTCLLHLLGMKPDLIASTRDLDEHEIERQLSETEAILIKHLKVKGWEQAESILQHLFDIDFNSPSPLNQLAELVAEAKSLWKFAVDSAETPEASNVIQPAAFELTDAEKTEADRVLFNLPLPIREAFVLCHVAGFDSRETASILKISESEVEHNLTLGREIMLQYIEGLLVGMLMWLEKQPDALRMSETERQTAWRAWKALPKECRSLVRLHMLDDLSVEEIAEQIHLAPESVRDMVEFTRNQLAERMEILVIGWLLLNLDKKSPPETILRALHTESFIEESLVLKTTSAQSATQEEIVEAEITLADTELLERDSFELFAVGLDVQSIASILNIEIVEVEKHLGNARRRLGNRLERLIVGLMQKRMKLRNAPKLNRSETTAARIAFRTIPGFCQKPFVLFMATGFSEEEIAETLGLLSYQVRRRILKAKKTIRTRAVVAAIASVRRDEDLETARKRVLAHVRFSQLLREDIFRQKESEPEAGTPETREHATSKAEDDFVFIRAESIEIEKMIEKMDFDCREAFVLGFGAGLDTPEIAAILGTDESAVLLRLEEAIDVLRNNIDYLVVGMLHRHFRYPDASRMTLTEIETAKAAYRSIPKESRKTYILFRAEYQWKHDIASKLGLSVEEVERQIGEADQAILRRYLHLSAILVREVREGRPIGEILLGEPKQIRFPSTVWDETEKYTTRKSEPRSDGTRNNRTQSNRARSVSEGKNKEKSEGKRSLTRPALKRAKYFLGSVGMLFSQMGAASPTGKAATGLAVPVLATLAAPFLWVMSLLISGQVYGLAFVRTAPTLEARRWLIRQLFYGYSIIFVTPITLLAVLINLGFINPKLQQLIFTASFVVLFIIGIIYAFRVARSYNALCILNMQELHKNKKAINSERVIKLGFAFEGIFILFYLWSYAKDEVFPLLQDEMAVILIMRLGVLTCFTGIVHVSSYFLFRYFCNISKDENSFQKTPPIQITKKATQSSIKILEFLRLCPFALFPNATGIWHLLTRNIHPFCTALEMLGFSAMWMLVWYWNVESQKRMKLKILFFFVIQTAIMYYVRITFYSKW